MACKTGQWNQIKWTDKVHCVHCALTGDAIYNLLRRFCDSESFEIDSFQLFVAFSTIKLLPFSSGIRPRTANVSLCLYCSVGLETIFNFDHFVVCAMLFLNNAESLAHDLNHNPFQFNVIQIHGVVHAFANASRPLFSPAHVNGTDPIHTLLHSISCTGGAAAVLSHSNAKFYAVRVNLMICLLSIFVSLSKQQKERWRENVNRNVKSTL